MKLGVALVVFLSVSCVPSQATKVPETVEIYNALCVVVPESMNQQWVQLQCLGQVGAPVNDNIPVSLRVARVQMQDGSLWPEKKSSP